MWQNSSYGVTPPHRVLSIGLESHVYAVFCYLLREDILDLKLCDNQTLLTADTRLF